jgi:hypothetical protein
MARAVDHRTTATRGQFWRGMAGAALAFRAPARRIDERSYGSVKRHLRETCGEALRHRGRLQDRVRLIGLIREVRRLRSTAQSGNIDSRSLILRIFRAAQLGE